MTDAERELEFEEWALRYNIKMDAERVIARAAWERGIYIGMERVLSKLVDYEGRGSKEERVNES